MTSRVVLLFLIVFMAFEVVFPVLAQDAPAATQRTKPTIFIIGDSTVRNGTPGQRGWGSEVGGFFDADRVVIENHAMGGRSSRTFRTEGRWEKVLAAAKPGDFVLVQFGHNDPGPLDDEKRARGTLPGIGEESKEVFNPITKKQEVVHTYGWYMRQYIREAKAQGLTPVVLSYVPRCPAAGKEIGAYEGPKSYAQHAKQVAQEEGVAFVDLYGRVWEKYRALTAEEIKVKYFTDADNTHTNKAGAKLNATCVVEGLAELKEVDFKPYLKR